jgi:hypothetical protein
MLKPVNETDGIIASRLVELLARNAPWHRSTWSVGTSFTIAELLEASGAVQSGVLSEASIRRLASSCKRVAGKDPALRDQEKSAVVEHLREIPRLNGLSFFALQQIQLRIESNYLLRWAERFQEAKIERPERVARCLATYLLDAGFSEAFLHSWFKSRLFSDAREFTLEQLCEEAHSEIATKGATTFDVLVAFKHSPRSASGYPSNWLSAAQVSEWLKRHSFSTSGVRPSGGLVLKIEAKDVFSASEAATALVDGYVARASVATDHVFTPWPLAWVKDHPDPFPYHTKHRGVQVKALYREDQIFASPTNSNVDAAIELLAHLQSSSPSAAIAGGWAAIESLLGEPGNRSGAADSLAALVACSVPRAELTHLSHVVEKAYPELAPSLRTCTKNRDRAVVIASLIVAESPLCLPRPADSAAVSRVRNIIRNPTLELAGLQTSVAEAFHRLYRQRNLILHGGMTNSVALVPSLRTASRLAGAGVDRIAHSFYVQGLAPLELAARARIAIALAPPMDPVTCVDLLGA